MPDDTRQVGVVFAHWRIPERRLLEHLAWNAAHYGRENVSVYPVVERAIDCGATDLRFVEMSEDRFPRRGGRMIFSLALAKNAGIRRAVEDGCNVVIATDTDVAFPLETFARMMTVRSREAIVPVYLMVRTFAERFSDDPELTWPDRGMTGTLSLTADNWRHFGFDETAIGYGGEDGTLYRAIQMRGFFMLREPHFVHHIAHDPEKHLRRVPGRGSEDCWNRESINPDNFEANRKA